MTEKGTGYIPSPEDERDYPLIGPGENALFGALNTTVPTEHLAMLPLIDFIRDQGGTNSCFPAGTRVLLEGFTERPIEQIAPGNRVRTHTGRSGAVTKVSERPYEGLLYSIKVGGWIYPLEATPEHPVAVIANVSARAKHGDFEPGELTWRRFDAIRPGDRVVMPADTREFPEDYRSAWHVLRVADYLEGEYWEEDGAVRAAMGRRGSEIPAELGLTPDIGRLLGLFLAEGSFLKPSGTKQGVAFTFARHEALLHTFVLEAMRTHFDLEGQKEETEQKPNVTTLLFYSSTVAQLFYALCGEGALQKRVPDVFFETGRDVKLALIRGWFQGDGSQDPVRLRRKKDGTVRKAAAVQGVTSSEELHRGLYRLASLCNIKLSTQQRKVAEHQNAAGRELNLYGDNILKVFPDAAPRLEAAGIKLSGRTRYRKHALGYLCRVEEVSMREAPADTKVYNLEVEGDHSYVAEGIAVHNCVWQSIQQQHYIAQGVHGVQQRLPLSVMFGYYHTRLRGGTQRFDNGCFPRLAWQVAEKIGFCIEDLWPFKEPEINRPPSLDATSGAIDQRWVHGYYHILGRPREEEVRQALSNNHPVVFGTVVDNDFKRYKGSNLSTEPMKPPTGHSGRHMMCAVAYDQDGLWVINSWGCYDDKTEILTAAGWKSFADVVVGEPVATLNSHGELEYQNTTDVQRYIYDGELWSYQSQGVDLVVTPNHNMLIGRRCREGGKRVPKWERVPADRINTKHFLMKKTAAWSGEEPPYIEVGPHRIPTELWVEFLGYFLSEGHARENVVQRPERVALNGTTGREKRYSACSETQYLVGIHQTKSEGVFKMGACLRRMPAAFTRITGGWQATSSPLCEHLLPLGKAHQKYIPPYVKRLSPRLLRVFLKAACLGDGSPVGRNGSVYYTSSKRLADDIQEVALKAGMCADIREDDRRGRTNARGTTRYVNYQVAIKPVRGETKPKGGFTPTKIPYKGFVRCVTVPNGLVYVRRNGKAVWSGNSDWGCPDPSGFYRSGFFHMSWEWVNWSSATDWWAVQYPKMFV